MKIFRYILCLFVATIAINMSYAQTKKERRAEKKLEREQKIFEAVEQMVKVDTSFYFNMKGSDGSLVRGFNASTSTSGYFLKVDQGKIECYLPYFGVVRTATLAGGGISFTSDEFTYRVETVTAEKGYIVEIKAVDKENKTYDMTLIISFAGNSSLSITTVARQTASYTGVIEEN